MVRSIKNPKKAKRKNKVQSFLLFTFLIWIFILEVFFFGFFFPIISWKNVSFQKQEKCFRNAIQSVFLLIRVLNLLMQSFWYRDQRKARVRLQCPPCQPRYGSLEWTSWRKEKSFSVTPLPTILFTPFMLDGLVWGVTWTTLFRI